MTGTLVRAVLRPAHDHFSNTVADELCRWRNRSAVVLRGSRRSGRLDRDRQMGPCHRRAPLRGRRAPELLSDGDCSNREAPRPRARSRGDAAGGSSAGPRHHHARRRPFSWDWTRLLERGDDWRSQRSLRIPGDLQDAVSTCRRGGADRDRVARKAHRKTGPVRRSRWRLQLHRVPSERRWRAGRAAHLPARDTQASPADTSRLLHGARAQCEWRASQAG